MIAIKFIEMNPSRFEIGAYYQALKQQRLCSVAGFGLRWRSYQRLPCNMASQASKRHGSTAAIVARCGAMPPGPIRFSLIPNAKQRSYGNGRVGQPSPRQQCNSRKPDGLHLIWYSINKI